MIRTRSQLALALALAFGSGLASAQEMAFHLDPQQSRVDFSLGASLHTVHGAFRMKDSTIRFNPSTGAASGEFVVDATSGDTGNQGRDKKMHREILESGRFPEIRLAVQSLQGSVSAASPSQVQVSGILTLHGTEHPFAVSAPVHVNGSHAEADVSFEVPYIQWGLKNPSTFILRVSDKVAVVVHAVGTLTESVPVK